MNKILIKLELILLKIIFDFFVEFFCILTFFILFSLFMNDSNSFVLVRYSFPLTFTFDFANIFSIMFLFLFTIYIIILILI